MKILVWGWGSGEDTYFLGPGGDHLSNTAQVNWLPGNDKIRAEAWMIRWSSHWKCARRASSRRGKQVQRSLGWEALASPREKKPSEHCGWGWDWKEMMLNVIVLTKVHTIKAMVFPVVTYRYESWTIMKAECQRIHSFELSMLLDSWVSLGLQGR